MSIVALSSLLLSLLLSTFVYADFVLQPPGALRKGKHDSTEAKFGTTTFRTLAGTKPSYKTGTLQVPIDHYQSSSQYEPHSTGTFQLRYFFDDQFYQPGGPIIVLASGEADAEDRIPYLTQGIVNILANATNGIGVILEHRYYGKSFPVSDLSTENMRFLTTEQSIADAAYFSQHVTFPGHEDVDLTAPGTPYIAYGGSYAGAFVAFLRVTYPNLYYGAISSSAVTQAIWDYWWYYEPIRQHGPQACIQLTQQLTDIIDKTLMSSSSTGKLSLKTLFGLQDLAYDNDFVNTISYGISSWQAQNWDPKVSSPEFTNYCTRITSTTATYPFQPISDLITSAGYEASQTILNAMINYMAYIKDTIPSIAKRAGEDIATYFSNNNASFYAQDTIDTGAWRSWPWQYCTEYGFLQTGSGVPSDTYPLISRLIDLDYTTLVCKYAFNITKPANTDVVNNYGGWNLTYDRLAFVDGSQDPWLGATPHSPAARQREDSLTEPFVLMEGAVHHWDENGLGQQRVEGLPPTEVLRAQARIVLAVQAWLKDFRAGASTSYVRD